MTQNLDELYQQPTEDFPDSKTNRKIRQLDELRRKIRLARNDLRVAPTRTKEIALQTLIRQEEELSGEVGFGIA